MIMRSDVSSIVAILKFLSMGESGAIPEKEFKRTIGSIESKIALLEEINRIVAYLRLSCVTMFQFRLENMLTNVLAVFVRRIGRDGFRSKAQTLMEIAEMDDVERKLDTLMILQSIRNSLHNNGIHNNDDLILNIDDNRFVFLKGKPVRCASWRDIVLAIEAVLLIIEKLLKAPIIKEIPEPISDTFAEASEI